SQIRTSFETAKSQQRIAFLEYEQTILTGYLEVLDRINAYSSFEEQLMLKNDEVQVQRRAVDNANTMLSVGYANYLEVINSHRRALAAELEYVEWRKGQMQNIVMLYKRLGGGWMLRQLRKVKCLGMGRRCVWGHRLHPRLMRMCRCRALPLLRLKAP